MGVVRHPGSIGVRRGPDRSVGGMRHQGPVDRFDEAVGEDLSLAEKPSNWPLSDAEWDRRAGVTSFGDSGTSQRATPMSAGYVPGWGTDFAATSAGEILGAGSLPGTQRALAEWAASQLPAPTPFSPARTQQSEIADVFEQAIDLMRPLALHDLGVGRDSAQGAALLPFPALGWVDDVARGGKQGVGWLRRLLGGGDEGVDLVRGAVQPVGRPRPMVQMRPPAAPSTAATRAGRHGWVEPPPPTAGPPAGGVSRAARPTVGMHWRRSQGVPMQGSSVVPHSDELPWFTTNRMAGDAARAREPGLDPAIRAIREQMAQGADPSKWQSSQYFDVGDSVSRYRSGNVGEDLMSPSGVVAAQSGRRVWQPARARDAYWFAPEGAADWLRGNPVRFVNGDIPPEIAGQMSRTPRTGTYPISVEPRPGPGGYSVHKGDYIDWVNPDAGLGKGA